MEALCYWLRASVVPGWVGLSFLEMMDQFSRKCLSKAREGTKKNLEVVEIRTCPPKGAKRFA